jgi:hypothetical protein
MASVSISLTYYAHFEGDVHDFEQLLNAKPDQRIECRCGAVLELRGDKAVNSRLTRDWKINHTGPGHEQKAAQ